MPGSSDSGILGSLSALVVRPLIELNDRVNELTALERGINSTRIGAKGP
jgi:hypothetical protein